MCPSGWKAFNGFCYFNVGESLPWNEANQACSQRSSKIPSILSAEEGNFIANKVVENKVQWIWLAATFHRDSNTWSWNDGSRMVWTNFWKTSGISGQCFLMHCSKSGYNGWLNAVGCQGATYYGRVRKQHVVCEKPIGMFMSVVIEYYRENLSN